MKTKLKLYFREVGASKWAYIGEYSYARINHWNNELPTAEFRVATFHPENMTY